LELRRDRYDLARQHFRAALAIGRNDMERKFYQQRIQSCGVT